MNDSSVDDSRQLARDNERMLELYDRLDASLLRYLGEATPWTDSAHAGDVTELHNQAAEQEQSLQTIADVIFERHLRPISRGWPNEFATLHDLSLEYVIGRVVFDQRTLVDIAEELMNLWSESESLDIVKAVHARERNRLDELRRIQRSFATTPTDK